MSLLMEKIESRLDKSSGCWLWTGSRTSAGYGNVTDPVTKETVYVHRAVWIELRGPIPQGMAIDHIGCPVHCANPDHLEIVTWSQNGQNRRSPRENRNVAYDKRRGRWYVHLTLNRKVHYGGSFATVEEARVAARDLRNRLMTHNRLDRAS